MSWVEIDHFTYTYPGTQVPVLRDLTLSIDRGSFVVITGRSGSGKSTLGKALAGFVFQDDKPERSGNIFVNGTDMSQIPLYEASQHVAYVQQNPEDQFCTLTVDDEIAFGLENHRVPPEEIEQRIVDSLKVVQGLPLRGRELSTLSGGEKQKAAIASMLALSPDVLILDEPTSNLDPQATQNIFETLYHMREDQNLTVIIIEHKLSQLARFNPHFFVLEDGELQPIEDIPAFQASLAELKHPLPEMLTDEVLDDDPFVEFSKADVNINGNPILHDIDFRLVPGEFVALMGPNGSGKSTLLETIVGFHKLGGGSLNVFGKDISSMKTFTLVNKVGFLFQNPDHQLFTQSVWDEAALTLKNLRLLDKNSRGRLIRWLDYLGLSKQINDHPQRLSYGEKRRLNLLAVILHQPQLLLIDEILIGQDMANAHIWMQFLQTYAEQGHTVLLVNHHAELTAQYCDRIVFLREGRIILDRPINDIPGSLRQASFPTFTLQDSQESVYA
jgi:energy-coupling factor transporter ATP-binding protein EcfA2